MEIFTSYKVRLYPNQDQRIYLNKTFGCCRFLWNQMLHERKSVYQQLKDNKEQYYAYKYKTEKEYKEIYPFLKEVDSIALQQTRKHLVEAYITFRKSCSSNRKVGLPRFKSKRNKQSFTTTITRNNIKIDFTEKKIKIPKLKTPILYSDDRTFNEPIRSVTVSKTKSGKYYASILVKKDIEVIEKTVIASDKIIAFDMSFPNFLVSENYIGENPRFYKNAYNSLKRLHRRHSRTKLKSRNREKMRIRLARKYESFVNKKTDWMHKFTRTLANEYDAIILENLNIEGMKKFNKGYAKTVTLDFSWFEFTTVLEYKLKYKGGKLIKVDRFFPSSKMCSKCGHIYKELRIDEREWTCKKCNSILHRDINASINLKQEGLKILQNNGITVP